MTPTSRIRAGNGPRRVALIWKMRPSSPAWSRRRSSRIAGLKRSMWPTVSIRPAAAAASIIAWASSRVAAIGFSTSTLAPRAKRRERRGEVEAGRRDDADEVELLLRQHPLRVLEPASATPGGGLRTGAWIGIGDRDQVDPVDDLVPDSDVVAAHHPETHHAGAQRAFRWVRHLAAAASSGPSSAAVSLTAPMTVATSSSVSDGWTGMLSTCSVRRSVTG